MSKKTILILGIVYTVVTLILHNVLETTIGGILYTLSFIALVVGIIGAIYYIIKFSIKQFIYNYKNRNGIE
ncbi:hypothetical protein [Texcoconibacillus texcoconensis]|uniref:Uncharacterized protein n=1 Tax=Texcoconibacillus texcoconensis TaxID=1095777 RepID=A0A840QV16_9BACI|nr:hypothetical protein [Texcoconibacillus texcoconensis]MBB5175111.1 hypothetical protein [Texcoconibacillus texcoconensis]